MKPIQFDFLSLNCDVNNNRHHIFHISHIYVGILLICNTSVCSWEFTDVILHGIMH